MLTAERLREVLDYDPATGEFAWRLHTGRVAAGQRAGCAKGDGYTLIRVDRVKYRAHRLVWLHVHGRWPAEALDHIDGDRANNRLANLREATVRQNVVNSRAKRQNKHGIKGVIQNPKSGTWTARIRDGGRRVGLGTFPTQAAAAAAYAAAARRIHGEYARIGEPPRVGPAILELF